MPVGDHRINNADYLFKYHIICVILDSKGTQFECGVFAPQRGTEEVSARICPKHSWAGFCVDFSGRSNEHDPGNSHSQDRIPHDGR